MGSISERLGVSGSPLSDSTLGERNLMDEQRKAPMADIATIKVGDEALLSPLLADVVPGGTNTVSASAVYADNAVRYWGSDQIPGNDQTDPQGSTLLPHVAAKYDPSS